MILWFNFVCARITIRFLEISDIEKKGQLNLFHTLQRCWLKISGSQPKMSSCWLHGYCKQAPASRQIWSSKEHLLKKMSFALRIMAYNSSSIIFLPNRIRLLQNKLQGGNLEILACYIHRDQMADRYWAGFCSGYGEWKRQLSLRIQ